MENKIFCEESRIDRVRSVGDDSLRVILVSVCEEMVPLHLGRRRPCIHRKWKPLWHLYRHLDFPFPSLSLSLLSLSNRIVRVLSMEREMRFYCNFYNEVLELWGKNCCVRLVNCLRSMGQLMTVNELGRIVNRLLKYGLIMGWAY